MSFIETLDLFRVAENRTSHQPNRTMATGT
jgi:hypothetical protein